MRTLGETEAVILEVTLFGTMISGPQFYNVVAFMKQYGFVVYDFCGFLYRPFDNALSQVDMVFVREQGLFRRSHVFATPEQRKVQFQGAEAEFAVLNKNSDECGRNQLGGKAFDHLRVRTRAVHVARPERQLVHDPAEHREAAHRALRDELALAQPEID